MKKLHAGTFLVALSMLMYEILLTRIFSVTMWYHFAFIAISIAMFGLAFGSVIVHRRADLFGSDILRRRIADLTLLYSIAIPASFYLYVLIPHPSTVGYQAGDAFVTILVSYLLISIPFVLGGIVLCLLLTRFPGRVGTLYAADLIGAAAGCGALVLLLSYVTGPTAVLFVAAVAVTGALMFAEDRVWFKRVTISVLSVCILFGMWNQSATEQGNAPFGLRYVKGRVEEKVIHEAWNSYSRVTVEDMGNSSERPFGWGMSTTTPSSYHVDQRMLLIDSGAGTPITRFTGDLGSVGYLRYDMVNLAHHLRTDARVMVIGVGGGRDVLSALLFGQREIIGAEVNKAIIDTVTGPFGDFSGHLERYPNVHLVNDEARSFIAHSNEQFDLIQISLIDTWAATAAGAFVLAENTLYTLEGWNIFLSHLSDRGIFTVSRWYFDEQPGEVYRLVSLAGQALRDQGVRTPREHIIVVRNIQQSEGVDEPDGVGTLLVSKKPFTEQDIATLERVVAEYGFEFVLTPTFARDTVFEELAGTVPPTHLWATYPINIAPPTDDTPYFFHMLRFRDYANPAMWNAGANSFNVRAVAGLMSLLIMTTVLAGIVIMLSLHRTKAAVLPFRTRAYLVIYFAMIALGFMLVEVAMLQRLNTYLGHPTYSLSVVLCSLLLAGGVGSYLSTVFARCRGPQALVGLFVVVAVFGLATPYITTYLDQASLFVRIAVSVGILMPMGIMMGCAFPAGMNIVHTQAGTLGAFLWGINGALSVVASVLAIVLSISFGISTTLLCGVGAYGVAAICMRLLSTKPEQSTT